MPLRVSHFNALRRRALQGDQAALNRVTDSYLAGENGTMTVMMPVVSYYLSRDRLRAAQGLFDDLVAHGTWYPSEYSHGARCAMACLGHGLDEEAYFANNVRMLNVTNQLRPVIMEWWTLFISASRILDRGITTGNYLTCVFTLFSSMNGARILREGFRTETPAFNSFIMNLFIAALKKAPNNMFLFTTMSTLVESLEGDPNWDGAEACNMTPGSFIEALSERTEDMTSVFIRCLQLVASSHGPMDGDRLNLWVEAETIMKTRIVALRRALAREHIVTTFCFVLRCLSKKQIAFKCRPALGDLIGLLLRQVVEGTSECSRGLSLALRAHIIGTILDLETGIQDVANWDDAQGQQDAVDAAVLVFRILGGSAVLHSFHKNLLNALRNTDKRGRTFERSSNTEGPIYRAFLRMKRIVNLWVIEHQTLVERSMLTRRICLNPNCQTPSSSDLPPRRCLGCMTAEYCSYDCQREHWTTGGHKANCKILHHRGFDGRMFVPPRPRDLQLIYATLDVELQKPSNGAIFDELSEVLDVRENGDPANLVINGGMNDATNLIVVNYGEERLEEEDKRDDELPSPDIQVMTLASFRNKLKAGDPIDFDEVEWREVTERRTWNTQSGYYVAIMVGNRVVDITTRERIRSIAMPPELTSRCA